ncbi:hypothetical protein SCUP515_04589 [Seiridium cupressi]
MELFSTTVPHGGRAAQPSRTHALTPQNLMQLHEVRTEQRALAPPGRDGRPWVASPRIRQPPEAPHRLEVTGGHLVVQVASQGKRRGDSCLHHIWNYVRHPVDDGKLRECMQHLGVVWWAPLALSVAAGASVVSLSAQAWDRECHWECYWTGPGPPSDGLQYG